MPHHQKVHGSPNANTFFGPKPEKVPLPQNTIPSEIDGPALHGPPLAQPTTSSLAVIWRLGRVGGLMVAMNAKSGSILWSYTTSGRNDTRMVGRPQAEAQTISR
jgi:hypothetical protein